MPALSRSAAGTGEPWSVPGDGFRHQPVGQWVVAGRGAVGGRDLSPTGHAELLAKDVRTGGSAGLDQELPAN